MTSGKPQLSSKKGRTVKLPAWMGSILFHAVVFLLVLFWFSFSPDTKSAPGAGERNAAGSIVFQSDTNVRQQSESLSDSQYADSDLAEMMPEQFSSAVLDVPPSTRILSPGQHIPHVVESGTDLAASLQSSVSNNMGIGNQTGETTVEMFGMQGKGRKFMYVFDRSGSMSGVLIRRAKEELIRSFSSLSDFHQFNMIFYSNGWQLWRSEKGRKLLIYATETEKENARRFISNITANGGTRHFEPLNEAIAHHPDVIFFLTDGEAQDDLTAVQLREIEQANGRFGRGTQMNVIQFGSGGLTDPPSKSLQQLAADNHGQYLYINVAVLK